MDDMDEYRRRHREAYLKRVGGAKTASASDDSVSLEREDSAEHKSTSYHGNLPQDENVVSDSDSPVEDAETLEKGKRERHKLAKNDEDYEASLELAKKLQREFDSMDEVRKPDDTYKECLLSSVGQPSRHDDGTDMDLQRAIAKSLVDM